jgi:hypothetical protein
MKQKYIQPEIVVIELHTTGSLLELSGELGGSASEPGLTREFEWEEE